MWPIGFDSQLKAKSVMTCTYINPWKSIKMRIVYHEFCEYGRTVFRIKKSRIQLPEIPFLSRYNSQWVVATSAQATTAKVHVLA